MLAIFILAVIGVGGDGNVYQGIFDFLFILQYFHVRFFVEYSLIACLIFCILLVNMIDL